MWFRKKLELLHQPVINFLCEQDGSPEQLLKRALVTAFDSKGMVDRAYLVRVDYGDPSSYEVALCVVAKEKDQKAILKEVAACFSRIFNRETHLDTLFLTPVNCPGFSGDPVT
jgi:hypothetical protein